jgi:2-succinyl-5-enolpyruvyl-6-hydroxy-3-cyclohexene-1-carboxylate synthase
MLSSVTIPARSSTERSSTKTASPAKSRRPSSNAQASRRQTNTNKKPFCGTLESSQRQQQLILGAQTASDVAKALLNQPHKANHVNVCTALHRVAKLSNSSSSKLDDATLSQLLAATVVVLKGGRFTARHLSNTLWALAKLGDPSPQLLDEVAATFSRKLISAAPCEISMALWGLVTAGRVEEAVLAPIARSLQPRLHEFAVRDLAGISW